MSNTFGDNSTVGPRLRKIGFTGGGPVAQPWTPTFSGAGASLEVHFLNLDGAEILIKTYTLSATVTGIYGIGTFLADLQSQGNAYPEGFIAYCRNAPLSVGRTGSQKATTNNILYDQKGNALVSQPENMNPGDALHWCMVAGSNGWKIYPLEATSGGATPVITQASQGTPNSTQPTVSNTTSTTVLAANLNRKKFGIQNNSAANIMFNMSAGVLAGIVPTSSNIGYVLVPGQAYESGPEYVSTAAITVFQSSGGSINTISVIEG